MASSNAISSNLLRRLAAAVDCQAFDTDVWVVARLTFPHTVDSVHPTLAAATAVAAGVSDSAVFGPYANVRPPVEPEAPAAATVLGPICYHDRKICEIKCFGAVGPVTMVIEFTGTDGRPVRLTQEDSDAVVLSQNAYSKFFLPYLFEMYGAEHAYERRQG